MELAFYLFNQPCQGPWSRLRIEPKGAELHSTELKDIEGPVVADRWSELTVYVASLLWEGLGDIVAKRYPQHSLLGTQSQMHRELPCAMQ